ncbi:MAG: septum formation initiator family protein [Pseudomonadota bacterium]
MRFIWRLFVDVVAPAFLTCWTFYFAYDAIIGATGFRALTALRAEAEVKSAEVADLTVERRRLEIVAEQLNPRSLNADMAEEKIRTVLGYVEEGDLVIPRDELEQILKSAAAGKAGG